MQVIVNGIPLLSPRSGIGNYVYQNFRILRKMTSEVECDFYYGIQWSSRLKEQATEPYTSLRRIVKRLGNAYPAYRVTLDALFRIGQWFRKYDLYHETNYVPMNFDGPTLVTVYDMSFSLYPEMHPADRIRYMEKYFYTRLDRVSHFITISEATKQVMIEHLGLSKDKITVAPLGVDPNFRPLSSDVVKTAVSKYGLNPGSYLLYVGTIEPRKNIITLLRAYADLPGSLRQIYPLVLAGGAGWLMDNLESEVERLGIRSMTRLTGYVHKEYLPCLYNGAAVFVYPSLYEGFGLPVLEAMACGTPVITSNVSSLPEVAGNAGVLIHPDDVKQLTRELEDLLTNPARRNFLIQRGLKRAKQFTWEQCAAKTLEVYHKVVKGL